MSRSCLVVGQIVAYAPDGCTTHSSLESRDVGVARGLAALGWAVDLASQHAGPTPIPGGVRAVPLASIEPDAYDAILVPCQVSLARARALPSWPAIRAHRSLVGWFDHCDPDPDLAAFRAILGSSTRAIDEIRAHAPGADSFLLPWAVPDAALGPPAGAPPWEGAGARAVHCGSLWGRELPLLARLAAPGSPVEPWVAGYLRRPGGAWSPLSEADRGGLDPGVRLFPGPGGSAAIPYGLQFPAYRAAAVGLVFGVDPTRMRVFNSKLWDMLAFGLPVACEASCLGAGLVMDLGAGRVFPWGDAEALAGAVRDLVRAPPDRERIRREALALGTWADRARQLSPLLVG